MLYKYKLALTTLITSSSLLFANAQTKVPPESIQTKMQWFADAKLGIFIHYGIYAVNGINESWSFHNKEISYPDY
ncbi:MAG TPA: alpha-L-fucosidase, partial [Sediminibacterium sp.]|nr:alpha-L-fucosidase [Sediminibacterium sp.]